MASREAPGAHPAAICSAGAGTPRVLFSLMFNRNSLAESALRIASS